jgi:saccharopine dehydrogenase-like NADP-dependent oxidoreductase
MAARAVRELPTVEAIDVAAAGRDPLANGAFSPPYALQTLIDELTLAPVVLRGGEPVEIEPLSAGGEVDFGDPIGRVASIHTLHSELATFGDSFGCAQASFRLSLAPALEDRLRELAAASPEELAAASAAAVPPSTATISVHLVEASGAGRHVRVRAVTRPYERFGGSIVSTAAPAAAAVRLLARGRISARGALPPERCIAPEDLFAELEQRGCTFEVAA